jgi:hypothetical protein
MMSPQQSRVTVPPQRVIPITFDTAKYPPAIRSYLSKNRVESQEFILNAQARRDWLKSHHFRISADLCIDGRVSDFSDALGLQTGLLEMYRSGGCMDNKLDSWVYARRNLDSNRKLLNLSIGGTEEKRMVELRLVTVHYSSSHPSDASCAAWSHDTTAAIDAAQEHANKLNRCFKHNMVAIVALVDTDLDSIKLIGPAGELDTGHFGTLLGGKLNGKVHETIVRELKRIFPNTWGPILRLEPSFRERFYPELAERLVANIEFVRGVLDTQRPIELLNHQERIIFIGRPSDSSDHNAAFLITDLEPEKNVKNFAIALSYVCTNVIREALAQGCDDWVVPVVISIPHDDDDVQLTCEYSLGIERKLREAIDTIQSQVYMHVMNHISPGALLPRFLAESLRNLGDQISWCNTVNDRATRLFVPSTIAMAA